MSLAEVLGIVLSLITIGAAIVTALLRTLFLGIRSRIDRLEQKVEDDYKRCMHEIMRLTRDSRHE